MTDLVHTTTYQGYDIVSTPFAAEVQVHTVDGRAFETLRAAIDYCDEQWHLAQLAAM